MLQSILISGLVRFIFKNIDSKKFCFIILEQSRRDDMESLGYVLMYFNRGSLPVCY
jgi:hypothetical protein